LKILIPNHLLLCRLQLFRQSGQGHTTAYDLGRLQQSHAIAKFFSK